MFILYDLNMKQIPFPDGIVPLDIFVSSIAKERQTETIPGRVGIADYGSEYRERSVDLSLMIKSYNAMFYRTQRNRLYELFSEHDVFYIAESHLPSRVLKVAVDDSYIPERISGNAYVSTAEITCRTLDSVFWESIYTTKELNDSGYSATKEKYGIVDNIDIEKTQYSFPPTTEYNPNLINLDASVWENGSFYSSGSNNNKSNDKRMKYYLHVTPGQQYTIADYSPYNSALLTIGINEWDSSETFVRQHWCQRGGSRTFTAQGSLIKLALHAMDGLTILREFIDGKDGRIQTKLEEGNFVTPLPPIHHTFGIWNAGNVTIEPEFMDLKIRLNYTHSAEGVTIKNLTTGDTFILETELNGSHVVLDGMDVKYGLINGLRKSNRQRIRIVPGMNDFEVIADTFKEAIIDTKFYYR